MLSIIETGKALEASSIALFATFNENCAFFLSFLQLLHEELPLTFLVTCDIDCIVFRNQMRMTAKMIVAHFIKKTLLPSPTLFSLSLLFPH